MLALIDAGFKAKDTYDYAETQDEKAEGYGAAAGSFLGAGEKGVGMTPGQILAAILLAMVISAGGTWHVQDWRMGKKLAEQAGLHKDELAAISNAAVAQARAEQDKRLATEQKLALQDQQHTKELSDARLIGSVMFTTPPVCACSRLAVWFASLASVFVFAIPTPTGIPVHRSTWARICRPRASSPPIPVRSANASSMLYISTAGTMLSINVITRSLISPYRA